MLNDVREKLFFFHRKKEHTNIFYANDNLVWVKIYTDLRDKIPLQFHLPILAQIATGL